MNQVVLSDLSESPLFQGLSPKDLEYLNSVFLCHQISEGRTVFVENMPGKSLYLIKHGAVQISQMLAEVDEQNLLTLKAGEVFGEMAILDGGNRSATARISRNATLYSFSRQDFNTLMKKNSVLSLQLTLNIIRIFSVRVRNANQDYRSMLMTSLNRSD